MRLRIKEAIELHNFRKRLENKKNGIPENEGRLTQLSIAGIIWPNQSGGTARISASNLATGKVKKIEPEWVVKICIATGVDPNFIYGKPSKHDEEYEQNGLAF